MPVFVHHIKPPKCSLYFKNNKLIDLSKKNTQTRKKPTNLDILLTENSKEVQFQMNREKC